MKRLMIKVGEYQKDGQTKGEYVRIGALMESQNGEYVLLDPTVNLAGCLLKQRMMNPSKPSKAVMVSVFTDEPRQQSAPAESASAADPYDQEIPF